MPIENRTLQTGTKLIGRYHKQSYSCEVVEVEGGKLRYRLTDGREFKSPSAAGMAITGHACDGWVFWSVEKTERASTPDTENQVQTQQVTETTPPDAEQTEVSTEPATESIPTVEKPATKKTGVFLVPNQKGVPEGQIRWYCRECAKSFVVSAVEIPGICPAKHQIS